MTCHDVIFVMATPSSQSLVLRRDSESRDYSSQPKKRVRLSSDEKEGEVLIDSIDLSEYHRKVSSIKTDDPLLMVNERLSDSDGSIMSNNLPKGWCCTLQEPKEADHMSTVSSTVNTLLLLEQKQCQELLLIDYSSSNVTHVYNPLEYAVEPHSNFVSQYGTGPKKVLFLGMNPGPFGMAQTGVPFGDVASVKDWLLIKGHVHKPSIEHPKRLVDGLSCSRKEISGSRFWGLIRSITGTPEKFFANCYVHNYCPLCFMTVSARNVTPPSLKCIEKLKLESVCDKALFDVVELLQVRIIVCIGKYVEKRCKTIFKEHSHLNIFSIIHPSPINPLSNKGNWIEIATKQLHDMNIIDIMKST